nr:sister chromatid cohesion 1 protein 3 [Ipomoea batatas]
MFYSHTFLARKGPMGTVWCAAHLQHRLRKTDYTRTDILSTVECIMFPEVPIALRMSGHLLLGVVRIYSKQVDYFFQDCNYLELRLKKALLPTSVNLPEGATYDIVTNVNLPEGATQATYNSITLPETFQLDALQSDYDLRAERFVDTHLKPQEEITLEDQVPIGGDQYVAIYIDEDEGRELSTENIASGLQATPMEIDPHPPVGEGTPGGPRHSPPSTPGGLNESAGQEAVAQEFPETEVMRDASHDVGVPSTPMWRDRRDDVLEPDLVLAEQVTKDDQNVSPVVEEMLPSGGRSSPPQRPEHPSASAEVGQGNTSSPLSFGNGSPELAMRPSPPPPPPPPEPEQRRARQRKRKLVIDDALVLSNQVIRAGLNDTSRLKRARKEAPHTSLGIWRSNKRLKKDAMFFEPLITGQCGDLSNMHEQDFVFARAHPSSTDEAREEATGAQSPPSLGRDEMEIEHLRENVGPSEGDILHEVLPVPSTLVSSPVTFMHSPSRQEDFTPAPASLGEQSDQVERTIDSGVLPTPDPAASTGHLHSDMDTPLTIPEEDLRFEATALSDIPEFDNSAGDLSFLEQDESTPTGSQGTPEVGLSGKQRTPEFDALSTRTRAVAQYLKGQSSTTPVSEGQSPASTMPGPGDLSLNAVLEGKSRKICARMFFETLVLKNCGLIDVKQEEPYGDITLKATSKLWKEQL